MTNLTSWPETWPNDALVPDKCDGELRCNYGHAIGHETVTDCPSCISTYTRELIGKVI